jgi:hypothetical protein
VTDLSTLPPIFQQVLEALQLPDPAPRHVIDEVIHAVARRMPGVPEAEIATALRGLQALGLVVLPYLDAPVSPRVTADTRSWITVQGSGCWPQASGKEQ